MINEDSKAVDYHLKLHLNVLGLPVENVRSRSIISKIGSFEENSNVILNSNLMSPTDTVSIMSILQQEINSTASLTPMKIQKYKLFLDDADKVGFLKCMKKRH